MPNVITMFDQLLFELSCGHLVVLGRLQGQDSWTCEECHHATDLTAPHVRERLTADFDTATQIDLQNKERGLMVVRAS